jgi:hypothetical protein
MAGYNEEYGDRIEYLCTKERFNDYGHSLRDMALKNIKGEYVLLTNADNYFIPKAIEFINNVFIDQFPDIVIFDMVHSHSNPGGRALPAYSFFETQFERFSLDVSAAIVRSELASKVGFKDKSHDGDQTYFADIARFRGGELGIVKIHRILFVHN